MPSIIAGKRRGAKLLVPEGMGVRPTLARVREALFSMLTSCLGSLEGLDVLDPFAGAGLLGLEAWSRGAAHVDFVEMNRAHFRILQRNIATVGAAAQTTALQGQSPRDWPRLGGRKYDLVLCDPPYADGLETATLQTLLDCQLLKPHALVSIESDVQTAFAIPEGLELRRERAYGKCMIRIVSPTVDPSRP